MAHAMVLLVLGVLLALFSATEATLCRELPTCTSCLNDPSCGWCATTETCAPGTSSGPSFGNCTQWDFSQCGSGAPSSTAAPGGKPTWAPFSTANPTASPKPSPPSSGNWIGQGGDFQRTRRSRDTLGSVLPVKKWTYGPPPQLEGVLSAPIVYAGRVMFTVYFPLWPLNNATLVALNHEDGTVVGAYNIGQVQSVGPPAVDPHQKIIFLHVISTVQSNQVVAVGFKEHSVNGNVSLSYLWYGRQNFFGLPIYDQGVVSDGKFVFVPGGSDNNFLTAYSIAERGLQAWSEPLYGTVFGGDRWGPTLDGNGAQVLWGSEAGDGNNCSAGGLTASTGAATWTTSFNCSWDGYRTKWSPVVAPSGLILLSPWGLDYESVTPTAISKTNGSSTMPAWTSASCGTTSGHTFSPAVDDTYAYWVCDDGVHRVTLSNGASTNIIPVTNLLGSPIVTADYILVMSETGLLIVAKDASFATTVTTSATPFDMAYSNGWVFVTTTNATVDGIQLHNRTLGAG